MTIDTLRADHVGAYGGDVDTPHLDRMAAAGVLVERASTHAPLTRPAHASLFAGQLPTRTGLRDNAAPARLPEVPLLAEALQREGFRTAAFVSSVVLAAGAGIERGFEHYSAEFPVSPDAPAFLNTAQRRGDDTLADALGWLRRHREADRLFLWLHLYDPHDPYEPPEPYASRYPGRPYAGEVAWSDDLVGRLEAAWADLGFGTETLWVVTSDHGEGLGEHDEALHGFFAYESTLRVPLIVRGPRVAAGIRLDGPVGLVDLYPTLLDLLGVAAPGEASFDGRSLAAAFGGAPEGDVEPLYAESLVPLLHFGWSDLRVVRDGRWKYIQAPRPELYDLAADPGETDDLLARGDHPRAAGLRRALATFLADERAALAAPETAGVPEGLLSQLGALGYVGGVSPAETPTPGADPKDKIAEFRVANRLMRRGLALLHSGDHTQAAARFEEVLAGGVDSAELHLYLGRALSGLGDFTRAAEEFEEVVARVPTYAEAWLGMAAALDGLGDREGAVTALRRGQEALPDHAALPREEGRRLRLLRRPEEARVALARTLELAPEDAFAHAALGEALRDLGDLDGAVRHLERAAELEPEEASYWNSLGMTLGGSGRLDTALDAFRRATTLDPANHRYAYNLGLALLRLGRPAEARPLLQKTLELAPTFTPARQQLARLPPDAG